MNWGIEDFAAAAVLLIGAAVALAVVFRSVRTQPARGLLAVGVVLATLAIWAHLAVGIF